ncbi:30S ribosomal protein S16 [Nocardioides sp.]|uniref:30S ribosomal protein S16 n=1 Tax=Nocardioides sp. TaxID=35761 RepID=UPI002B26F68C|nr:30S ribosomal protein S16 [Nocardioides sp.]
MSVKIRLKRLGKVRVPQYRIVVVDSRKKRDGKVIEEIGLYRPKEEPSFIKVTSERAQYWLGVGAQPSEAVAKILRITGDWQTFKGIAGTEGTLKVAEEKKSKIDLFNEALKDAGNEPKAAATTSKKKADKSEDKAEAKSEEKAEDKAEEKAEDKAEEKPAEEAAPEAAAEEKAPEAADDADKKADA